MGHLKNISLTKWHFFDVPPAMSHFVIFTSIPLPTVSFDWKVTNYETKQKKAFFLYKPAEAYRIAS